MVNQTKIHSMVQSKSVEKRRKAAYGFGYNFTALPDKEQAWSDLIRLTQDKDDIVRRGAADSLGIAFPHIPKKYREQTWSDLIRLMQDKDKYVRNESGDSLSVAFPHIPENYREQAWNDLHRMMQDQDSVARGGAVGSLGAAFPYIPEKYREQARNDMIGLTQDKEEYVRLKALGSLGAAFPYISEKYREQAWNDLIRLTQDKDSFVQLRAADSLSAAFPYIPEKYREQAWNDLHGLTQSEDTYVLIRVADSLGTTFPYIPEKYREQAWSDLIRLTQDIDYVQVYAYHSLGRASIFKATNAENEEDFRKELEKALEYFESSTKAAIYYKLARFCLPFYRSFYTIIFRRQDADDEVKKLIAEAKSAVKGSESKEKLLEAVENLSNALKETQKSMEMNLKGKKCELNAYRRYCERALELLETTEEKAPGATRLIRKGLPIIDERIKGIISEIQEKSKTLCKQTKGTPLEDLGKEVNRHGQAFLQIRDPIGLEKGVIYMQITLSAICAKMPEEERREACELLKKANEELYIEDKVYLINIILGKVSSQLSFQTILEELKSEIKARFDKIEKNIDGIAQGNEVTRNLLIGYANKTQGILLKLLDESKNCESETQKLMKEFSDEIIKKLEEKDEKWFEKLKDELIKKEPEIEKELSSTPEIKSKWHKWIDYIKNKAEKETKEIIQKLPTEAVVLISAEKILEYGVPFLSAAMSSSVALPALIAILYAIRGGVPKDK